jgi:KipI family sensor histidine kinase inhibitor
MIQGAGGRSFDLHFSPLAESALLLRIGDGDAIDDTVVDTVTALTKQLDVAWPSGVTDVVPAYTTILVEFDPMVIDGAAIQTWLQEIAGAGFTGESEQPNHVVIPVAYGGSLGPDLDEMADVLGMSPRRLIHLHSETEYRVACMGFSPGWAYLTGLPEELTIPRRQEPRTRIPPGTLAVGGAQTGIYPLESPGGWHLIGRTPFVMFNPRGKEPFLLKQGDRVQFEPIDAGSYENMAMDIQSKIAEGRF